jgi:hypothetical protein
MSDIKLGKLPAKVDERTLKLSMILRTEVLPPVLDEFDVDKHLDISLMNRMYANDKWGDCVIAGRAHWTLRSEYFEQGRVLYINDSEVLNEYWAEQGYVPGKKKCFLCRTPSDNPPDNGLVMLDSLKLWRKNGWEISKQNYKVHAFAGMSTSNHSDLRYSVMLLGGGYIGIEVPSSAMQQFANGQPWTVVPGSDIEGGHAIYIVAYNTTGPICITWGRRQQMTWEFFDKYTDEAFAIVDETDVFMTDSPLDVEKLEAYLTAIC